MKPINLENIRETLASEVTHVLAGLEVGNDVWLTLRQINENGYNVFETKLGQTVLSIPYQEENGDAPDAYFKVYGYYSELEGKIAKKALEQYYTVFRKMNVMRGLRSEEKIVRIAA